MSKPLRRILCYAAVFLATVTGALTILGVPIWMILMVLRFFDVIAWPYGYVFIPLLMVYPSYELCILTAELAGILDRGEIL